MFFRLLIRQLDLVIILRDRNHSPEQDSNLGLRRIAFFADCKATALTTQPPWLGFKQALFGQQISPFFKATTTPINYINSLAKSQVFELANGTK